MSRNPFLERLADQHEAQIRSTLNNLEADIISQIGKVTDDSGVLTTKISIELRNDIRRYMEQYRIQADTLVRDYDQIVNSFMEEFGELNIPDKFKSLTEADLITINQLKFQSFSGFEDIANRYLTEINANVYQNAIAGKPFNEMVKDIRGLITGDVDRRGRSMSGYASQIAHDSVMQFDGQFTVYKAKEAGLDKYKYTGTLVRDSRDHCRLHIGKTYTEERIREIWTGNWAGKSEGDAFIVRGGYRCRHTWLPIVEIKEDIIPDEEQTPTGIFGEVSNAEKDLLKQAFGNKVTPISKVIAILPPLKKFQKESGGFYRSSDDLLNMGNNGIDEIDNLRTFIHEYGHRIDRQLGAVYLKNKESILNKYGKNTSEKVINRNLQSISHLQVQSLIDDTKTITKDLKKRRELFYDDFQKARIESPSILKKIEREEYYKKLNNELNVILSTEEIKKYLKYNLRTSGEEQIYRFKLKLKHKIFESENGDYDLQFSRGFNDYVGSITKNTMGGGHSKYYYNKSPIIVRDGAKKYTHRQTLEAFANYTQMSFDLNKVTPVMNMNVREIERKLMQYYAQNTTNSFDDFIKEFNKL